MKTDLADEIIYSRRKTLAISVLRGGKVVVRAPLRTSRAQIATFCKRKLPGLNRRVPKCCWCSRLPSLIDTVKES